MGAVLVVVGILGAIGIGIFATRLATDLGVTRDGSLQACSFITNDEVAQVLGPDAQASPMGGLADVTVGQVLDKRVVPDAPDCWIYGTDETSVTGRLALLEGIDASAQFSSAKAAASDGGYLLQEASGVGDEAFCTTVSGLGSAGILVRSGGRLVYVSLLDPAGLESGDTVQTCDLARQLAEQILR